MHPPAPALGGRRVAEDPVTSALFGLDAVVVAGERASWRRSTIQP